MGQDILIPTSALAAAMENIFLKERRTGREVTDESPTVPGAALTVLEVEGC